MKSPCTPNYLLHPTTYDICPDNEPTGELADQAESIAAPAEEGTSPGIPPVTLSLNSLRPKIDYEQIIAGIYEKHPETRPYNSKRLLRYLKIWAMEQGVTITITDSRIRHLKVWKEHRAYRKSGKTQYGYNSGDLAEENDAVLESAKRASLDDLDDV